jgi:methyl-accepting chemotaxis protein
MDQHNELLESLMRVIPFIQAASLRDIGLAVTDREKYIMYLKGKKLDLKITYGTPLKPGTAIVRAMEERRRVIIRGDKATFGLPYIAQAYPVTNEAGDVVGGIVLLEDTEEQDNLKEMASQLTDSISVLASTTEEISAQAQEIAAVTNRLSKVASESQERVKETDDVLNLIKSIANQTNLLGLNASIEAARVGDAGRGFGVVAQEIRKLATTTAESVQKIDHTVKAIQKDSTSTCEQLIQVNDVIAQVAEAVTHVAGAVQQAGAMTHKLDDMADKLSKD